MSRKGGGGKVSAPSLVKLYKSVAVTQVFRFCLYGISRFRFSATLGPEPEVELVLF